MSSKNLKPIAFIPPRYVSSSAGGAEVACRHFAEKLKKFKGIICNSPPEKELILQMGKASENKVFYVGEGIETSGIASDKDVLEQMNIRKPYIFYCGRREKGNNFSFLLEMFREYKKQNQNSLQFVTEGTHPVDISPSESSAIIDAGFVTEEIKSCLYKNALLTCQPSTKESFSIATMEAWLQKCPVMVNRRCSVLDYWVKLSGGGFSFADFFEFEELLNHSLKDKKMLDKMGESGYEFTKKNFSWEKIIDRFEKALYYFGYAGKNS